MYLWCGLGVLYLCVFICDIGFFLLFKVGFLWVVRFGFCFVGVRLLFVVFLVFLGVFLVLGLGVVIFLGVLFFLVIRLFKFFIWLSV